jgi:succinyl-CoA synthetase beta subunit
MKLFEYMGKEIFAQNGILVPRGQVAFNSAAVTDIATQLGKVVIKSQILSGGRGKAGGIKFANTPEEAKTCSEQLFGLQLNDFKVEQLLVEEKLQIDRELYLSIALDGGKQQTILIASAHGGIDIEEIDDQHIIKKHIDPQVGMLHTFTTGRDKLGYRSIRVNRL